MTEEGLALVDFGPLHMTVQVSEKGVPLSELAKSGAIFALEILKQQADSLSVIKERVSSLSVSETYPEVVNRMISAVSSMNDPYLTPLAAVAGAASDMVADYVARAGATKIIVDNGGDIAIRLREGETATVGLRLNLARPDYEYRALIDRDCGICTSGIGGRSFTLGVADGVTVVARQAAIADAAATFLGNKTVVVSPKVKRVLAESIYPDTDLVGVEVTHSVGDLSQEEIDKAMNMGKAEALRLMESGLICGAVISVKDHVDTTGYFVGALRKI
ncbi:MAG: FAD:protein FMN transferase [Deltaproteobacteria bacterium]|nr:FAD:protein FMN transferase [Deltaproteobacteria bacterium]MBW2340202.1 FAD:protein FMN transferase [Deltaproteobacteria bacterium]